MEYLEALYPIAFILAVYLFISFHDRGCKKIVICWRPFQVLSKVSKTLGTKGLCIVNAFATFFLLSYSKFCSISISLLKPVPLYDKYGNVTYTLSSLQPISIGAHIFHSLYYHQSSLLPWYSYQQCFCYSTRIISFRDVSFPAKSNVF